MSTMREMKRRIRSIQNTQQITKAMEAVSAAKLKRAQETAEIARPYTEHLRAVLARIVQQAKDANHPLLEQREGNRVGVVVITADRGLCGPYNASVLRRVANEMQEEKQYSAVAVGRKSRDYFRSRGYTMNAEYLNIGDKPTFGQAQRIAHNIMALYNEGVYDEIYLVYTKFVNALRQEVQYTKLLPIDAEQLAEDEEVQKRGPYIFEPEEEDVLNVLVPKYVDVMVYQGLVEGKASEHAARMVAMGSATQNAGEMIEKLNLSFNRARQAAITKEILEVVSGADALKHV